MVLLSCAKCIVISCPSVSDLFSCVPLERILPHEPKQLAFRSFIFILTMPTQKDRVHYHPSKLYTCELDKLHSESLKEWYCVLYEVDKSPSSMRVKDLAKSIIERREHIANRLGITSDDVSNKLTKTAIRKFNATKISNYKILFNASDFSPDSIIEAAEGFGLLDNETDNESIHNLEEDLVPKVSIFQASLLIFI